jgi:hypothetical protein
MSGVVPQVNTESVRPDSVDSSPEFHAHKRPKIDSEKAAVRVRNGREHEQGSSCVSTMTAYTLSSKDELNLGIITKDPATIADPARLHSVQAKAITNIQAKAVITDQAKAISSAKVEFYSRKREVYNQAYDEAMSSSGPTLRSDTKEKPVRTYPAMHLKYEAYQMERDAEDAAIV